jgi:ABC-type sugar transport system ATPase subunit
MKLGVVQQIDKPQVVYDDPTNLFVAKFLGTPPINVFEGTVSNGKLYIGDNAVLDVPGIDDQAVTVGIRPEGFILDPTTGGRKLTGGKPEKSPTGREVEFDDDMGLAVSRKM